MVRPPGPSLPPVAQALEWTYRYPRFTARAHRRYGPSFTVTIGDTPPAVVTVDREAVRRPFGGDPLAKRHGNDILAPVIGDRGVMFLEPAEHLARRRLLLPPFHGERVKAYAELMERLAEREIDAWRPSSVVRVHSWAQTLTLEVILQAVFGISDSDVRARFGRIFERMFRQPGGDLAFYFPKLARRSWWNPAPRWYWRQKDAFDALLLAEIRAARAEPRPETRGDILSMLVSAGDGLDDATLVDELFTLILAGHETTATAVAWGAVLLAASPSVLARAHIAADEDDGAYLDALCREILRIRSPAPVAAARFVLEPFPVGRYVVAPGTAIVVNAHGLHHDPVLYPQPDELRPERFLGDGPEAHAFLPFGGGAHRCLGASLALLEMKVAVRSLLRRFTLEPVAAGLPRATRRGITLSPRGGGQVRVAAR